MGNRAGATEGRQARVRIGLLGTLAVYDGAGRPVRVGGYRVRALLILLALDAGRVVPAYALIERLWDDDTPSNAGNSLQSLVSRLRTALRQAGLGDQVIESHPAGYRLAVARADVDALAFETRAREGSQALAAGEAATARRVLSDALGSWRGPALADVCGAEFAAGPAARLEELRGNATLDLIEAGLLLGESDSLIGELRAMIAADPLAERPRGLLMRALYASGRQSEALLVYQETRELLADRLGVDPSPQLEQIYLTVLRQDPPPGLRAPGGDGVAIGAAAPEPPGGDRRGGARLIGRRPRTSFVGRDADVARVRAMLSEGRLVTLTGPGGAGKTRLATELATLLAGSPSPAAGSAAHGGAAAGQGPAPDWDVWFVELAPVTDPAQVPYAVLRALGIRESPVLAMAGVGPSGDPSPVPRLVSAIGDRRVLLILDNCEHVVTAAAMLTDEILAGCDSVRVLATSREPLRIAGETLWPVPPLPVPPMAGDTAGTGQVGDYAAVRLLADRAAAVRPDFAVTDTNAGDVARICRALDGMPLAIELAAARLRTLSATQLAERLDARFELLTEGSRTAMPRHQTLRAVVAWSWELLSEPEQILARRLAVFPGGATLTAAEQVCHDSLLPAAAILPAVFGLVEKSFLAVDAGGEPRYRMLETVRAYCLERLAEAGEAESAQRAFAAHFLRLAERADPLLRSPEQQVWVRRLTAELGNIHAALRGAADRRDTTTAHRFALALGWFWVMRGMRQESATLAQAIMSISERVPLDAPDAFTVITARGVAAVVAAGTTWDFTAVRQPLADWQALMATGGGSPDGRPPHPVLIYGSAMFALFEDRDPERALAMLAKDATSADRWTKAAAGLMHSFFSLSLGNPEGAARGCTEALTVFREIGDQWAAALALTGQAEFAALAGEPLRAVAAVTEAMAISRELADWGDAAEMFASMARYRSRVGDFDGALANLEQAEAAARRQGEQSADLWLSFVRAELAWLRGDMPGAAAVCRELDQRMASKPGTMTWSYRSQIQTRAALAGMHLGDAATGRTALAAALRLAAESKDRLAVAAVLEGVAVAGLLTGNDRGNAERAATLLGAAHSIRGIIDHNSLDGPAARKQSLAVLGDEAFEAAYHRGRELSYDAALAMAADSL